MIGQTISHYKITAKLGEGGMGEVYLATDTMLDRPVALKFLSSALAGDPEIRERFAREARAAAAVRHPSVVTVFEIQEHHDRPFIVMEYVAGVTLREWYSKRTHTLDETRQLFNQICDGLKSAHDLGIIHRDLKPDNILIDSNNHARVLDFGLAQVRGASRLTRDGLAVGTAAYMAPEQIEGAAVDERADIWSLGVIFYEVLTGQNPFLRDFEHATMYAVLNEAPKDPSSVKPSIPSALSVLVSSMRARRREDRCTSLSEVIQGLNSQSLTSTQKSVEEPGLVVLPFEDISPSRDNEYFSDGLTEEIIADLSRIRSLRVISRTSAMRYKGTQKSVREIGRELGVSHVLEGSVRKAGDKLRITAQLIEAASDRHIWAEKYSGSLDDIFEIQEQVAGSIANAMQLTLTKQEQESLAAHPIDDPRAYDCYLQARHDMKWTEERLNSAKNKLEIGLEIVGENAVLYAGMAQLYYQYVNAGYHQDESIAKAEEYVRKAFELAPDLPSAHLVAGQLAQAFKGEQQDAVDHFKRALSQTPNDSEILFWLIIGYGVYGRIKEAGPLLDLAERIDPFNPVTHMARGWIHFTDGDFDAALTASKRSYAIEPSPMSGFLVALNMVYAGRMDDVLELKPSLEKLSFFLDRVMLMFVYGHEKRYDEAAALVNDDLKATSRRDCQWSWHLAAGYAAIERHDLALDWIENAVNRGFMNHRMLTEHDPYLTRLSGNPKFHAIVERARHAWDTFQP